MMSDFYGPAESAFSMNLQEQMARKQAAALGQADNFRPAAGPRNGPPGLFGEMAQRLQVLGATLNEAAADLTEANTRAFGERPGAEQSNADTRTSGLGGAGGSLLQVLDLLIGRAQSIREEARGLNARLA